ncbi:hypothetical protein FGO68_gene7709 [Halteria grandinella]|uniref:Uncharacterized protein n=1 Tax=Halteria grandinella TaxID=5974 RepID=A0A8J8T4D9_HALGN|nr:hypothetical protein FGO68_gene7709 [Halteria grandinella]
MENRSLLNNQIHEHQEDCTCTRGLQVYYFCSQQNCEMHKVEKFFCEDCFNEIMKWGEVHKMQSVPLLLEELKKRWFDLIEKEGQMFSEASIAYNSKKALIEYLDKQGSLNENGVQEETRLVCRDMQRFRQFREILRQYISEYEEYIQNFKVAKLHEVNSQSDSFHECLVQEFNYLPSIAKPEFILDNYRSCIQSCPVPQSGEEQVLREQILSLKVKVGVQNMLDASKDMEKVPISQGELVDTVSKLIQTQRKQEAQMNAVFSFFENLEGVASVINTCITQGDLANKIKGVENDLKNKVDQLFHLNEKFSKEELKAVEEKCATEFNNIEMRINSLQESLKGEILVRNGKFVQLSHGFSQANSAIQKNSPATTYYRDESQTSRSNKQVIVQARNARPPSHNDQQACQ